MPGLHWNFGALSASVGTKTKQNKMIQVDRKFPSSFMTVFSAWQIQNSSALLFRNWVLLPRLSPHPPASASCCSLFRHQEDYRIWSARQDCYGSKQGKNGVHSVHRCWIMPMRLCVWMCEVMRIIETAERNAIRQTLEDVNRILIWVKCFSQMSICLGVVNWETEGIGLKRSPGRRPAASVISAVWRSEEVSAIRGLCYWDLRSLRKMLLAQMLHLGHIPD